MWLEDFTFMNFPQTLTKVVKLCFSPNSSVLCSNCGWLAPFCASSFSLDWKAITLMGGRLIWLIPTLEYRPVIGWSISQGSGGTTMYNYKNNRSIIRVQVQPGPGDDKYNALCANTNTCTSITNTSMTMVLLRLRAFLSDEISLGWKMRRHRLNTDELFLGGSFRWSLVHLATKIQSIRSGPRQPNFPAYSRSHGCHVNKFLCKIMVLCFSENGPPSATHHHKSGLQFCLLSGRLILESCSSAKYLGILAHSP